MTSGSPSAGQRREPEDSAPVIKVIPLVGASLPLLAKLTTHPHDARLLACILDCRTPAMHPHPPLPRPDDPTSQSGSPCPLFPAELTRQRLQCLNRRKVTEMA